MSVQVGDKVRVHIDTHGGYHPMVGSSGYFADTVRAVYGDNLVLTHVSNAALADVEVTRNDHASVTVRGVTYPVELVRHRSCWVALFKDIMLATSDTYANTLRLAVRRLEWDPPRA